jgi:hypothetical protein
MFNVGDIAIGTNKSRNVYVSDQVSAMNVSLLRSNSISLVISIGCGGPEAGDEWTTLVMEKPKDTPEQILLPFLLFALTFVVEDNQKKKVREKVGNILIHCVYGQSRSVALTVAVFMFFNKVSADEALQDIRAVHTNTCVNPGFLSQLKLLEVLLSILGYDGRRENNEWMLAEVALLLGTYDMTSYSLKHCLFKNISLSSCNQSQYVYCICCNVRLGVVLQQRQERRKWILENTDPFWNGYRPIHGGWGTVSAIWSASDCSVGSAHRKKKMKTGIEGCDGKAKASDQIQTRKDKGSADYKVYAKISSCHLVGDDEEEWKGEGNCSIIEGVVYSPMRLFENADSNLCRVRKSPTRISCDCGQQIGWFEARSLAVCDEFVRVDLYCADSVKTRIGL